MPTLNLPNQLTLARFAITALFVVSMSLPFPHAQTLSLALFAAAAFTDYLDGYLARKHQLITDFGKLMDPLADKILMAAGFVLLTEHGLIAGWIVILILAREFLVTGLRLVASSSGKVLAAENLGKHKTAWQIIAILYYLVLLASAEPALNRLSPLFRSSLFGPAFAGQLLVFVALGLTLWSGVAFVMKNRAMLRAMTR